jgi:predicted metalloprotease with PDZ domain
MPRRPAALIDLSAVTKNGKSRRKREGSVGRISDVLKSGVADKSGLGPGMLIIAVNGRAFTPDVLKAAIRDAKDSGPAVELIVENTGFYKIAKLDYHGGERCPLLERVPGVPDRLNDILKPEAR